MQDLERDSNETYFQPLKFGILLIICQLREARSRLAEQLARLFQYLIIQIFQFCSLNIQRTMLSIIKSKKAFDEASDLYQLVCVCS